MAAAAPPLAEFARDAMAYVAEEEEEEDPEEVEPWVSSDSEPDEHPAPKPRSPSPDTQPEQPPPPPPPAPTNSASEVAEEGKKAAPWPGFPGASVFRLVVAGDKVGGLIGRRGEIVKRLCDETRARVRVLDATDGVSSRIVLISATEETQAELAPAMDAAVRIFKHVNDIEGINPDVTLSASAPEICCARLLVPKAQAVHLIGKQGTMIKLMQETTGATMRIIDQDDFLSNQMVVERIVEIRGASLKVLNALKSVLGLLRKFLVDHSVLHLFERKQNQAVTEVQDSCKENQVTNGYALPVNQDLLLSDSRSPLNLNGSRYLSYGHDPSVCDPYSPDIRRPTVSLISKIMQTMQIPLLQAEEIIGVRGQTIAHIRSVSGAVVVLEETGNYLDEVLVSIEGTSSQVQTAHQLIQEVLLGDGKVLPPRSSSYGNPEAGPVRPPFAPRGAAPASPEYAPPLYRDYRSLSGSVRHCHSAAYHGYRL
ncbi:RNA-binding KH domain-containing protein PEPPER isoform X1 [Triticum aestivum]|uniref:RNA-binding KH domain-containing protein PEPPER isoform X1 n=1 Tax=Triticum aestivum TaxID=4565 RepID=UPI001D00FE7F|nr:RNA-binding KH domain-containing protein PEPPER-like isoform X1 [Triticum aestivum]